MHKMPARVGIIDLVKVAFARVRERGMSHIVTKRDRLDQIKIEIQRAADRSRNARNELDVQASACDIVVLYQRKNLSLVGISVVVWTVKYFVRISYECRTQNACAVGLSVKASNNTLLGKA